MTVRFAVVVLLERLKAPPDFDPVELFFAEDEPFELELLDRPRDDDEPEPLLDDDDRDEPLLFVDRVPDGELFADLLPEDPLLFEDLEPDDPPLFEDLEPDEPELLLAEDDRDEPPLLELLLEDELPLLAVFDPDDLLLFDELLLPPLFEPDELPPDELFFEPDFDEVVGDRLTELRRFERVSVPVDSTAEAAAPTTAPAAAPLSASVMNSFALSYIPFCLGIVICSFLKI